ncbi:MAG: hypothetical protein U1E09_10625 [Methylococcales bacterium]|nr:hypothetical protein [Methylococcales bacterium]
MAGGEFLKKYKKTIKAVNIRLSGIPWIILTAISMLTAVHLHYRSPDFPYSPDSAFYIEQARNLVSSGSTSTTPYGLSPSDTDQVETGLFPIGFAIAIAAISTTGIDAKDVAIEISHWSAILLPWLLYLCFRNALGARNALVVAGLSVISPSVLLNSSTGLTDMFALALAVAAIGLTLNSKSTVGLIGGGLLAGMAYALRNAHLALLITLALYFCYLWLVNNTTDRRVIIYKNAASTFLGIAIIVLPVLIRNIYLFGSLNPYQMPPSTIGLIENLRTYLQVLIKDVTACSECGNYIAWSVPGLLALVLVTSCLSWLFIKYVWRNLATAGQNTIVISTTYVLVGSCIVIAARTRYQWGEVINIRHTLQYTPFLLVILLIPAFQNSTELFSKWLGKIESVFIIILFLFHINFALFSDAFQTRNNDSPILTNAYTTGQKHLCLPESNTFLVSNIAYLFRIECDARVRQTEPVNIAQNEEMLALVAANEGHDGLMATIVNIKTHSMNRPIHAGFFPGRFGLEARDFPIPDVDQKNLLDSGWEIVSNDEHGLLIQDLKDDTK